jgi:hypothetical protein
MSLSEKIVSQVEYYLEPARMAADRFLLQEAHDNDGFVPIGVLLTFPRMRKLVHPQIGAVAHVLAAASSKLEVSADATLVRPRARPPESPAHARPPEGVRAQLLARIERVLNDAHLIYDTELQAAIQAASPPEALRPGALGVRVPVESIVLHPEVAIALAHTSQHKLLAALVEHRAAPTDPAALAARAMIRSKLGALLPRADESALVRLSADGEYLERLRPTPEVRQLVRASSPGGAPPSSARAGESSHEFVMMSYNLLADMLCTTEQASRPTSL